jgi:flagellar FliL protein
MSAASSTPAEAGGESADGEGEAKKGGKKKLILLAAPVLLIGVVAGLWFSGILPGVLGMGPKPQEQAAAPAPIVPAFYEMPEILANLNAPGRRPSYMKLKAKLEIADSRDIEHVRNAQPRLLDLFNTYMREIRPEELRGSAGTHRLREELIARANIAVAPARVSDILFTEILVQ